jgi:hypothetical protein
MFHEGAAVRLASSSASARANLAAAVRESADVADPR